MHIKFVNHSSLIISCNGINILSDPWLFGDIFCNGWSLISKSCNINWNDINYVWISHEHPDHFHIPSLKSIPESIKKNIVFLYQSTIDKKVSSWLKSQNFKVKQLPKLKKIKLIDEVTIKTGSTPQADSWLLIDDGNVRFLNLNDCDTKTKKFSFVMKKFAQDIGRIDVLASQFGYACFSGKNKTLRKKAANTVIEQIDYQIEVLKPKYYIPFASFAYFSHRENFKQNNENNTVFDVFKKLSKDNKTCPVVMYPGDIWTIGNKHNNTSSLNKYKGDYKRALLKPLKDKTITYDIEDLRKKSIEYKNKLLKKNLLLRLFLPSATIIWINDLKQAIKFDLIEGLVNIDTNREYCDIEMSSDLVFGWFNSDYGGASAYISARISYSDINAYRKAYKYFYISNGNNRGETWPWFALRNRVKARLNKIIY